MNYECVPNVNVIPYGVTLVTDDAVGPVTLEHVVNILFVLLVQSCDCEAREGERGGKKQLVLFCFVVMPVSVITTNAEYCQPRLRPR